MYDDFDIYESCEEFYAEDSYLDTYWEDQCEMGFDPYMGEYTFNC